MLNSKLENHFHKQNISLCSLADHFNYSTNFSNEESQLIAEQVLISQFYNEIDPKSKDHSLLLILETSSSFTYLASAVVFECDSIICGGESECPITLYFNSALTDEHTTRLTQIILDEYSLRFANKELYVNLHSYSEIISKPFKKYLNPSSTNLVPVAGRYIYLNETYTETRLSYRKSVKPLINQTLRKFPYEVSHSENNRGLKNLFTDYKELHFLVSGRLTRSEESWKVQQNMLDLDLAFLLVIYNDNAPIGAAFFVPEGNILHYWSGAYHREYSRMGLSHLAVDYAIKWAFNNKIKFFNFGFPQIIQDNIVTEKRTNLSHFRQAFSSSMQIGANLKIRL